MKRSEMVKIIERSLKVWNGAYYDESLESYILSQIEEAGMLPPNNMETVYVPDDQKTVSAVMRCFNCHRWED